MEEVYKLIDEFKELGFDKYSLFKTIMIDNVLKNILNYRELERIYNKKSKIKNPKKIKSIKECFEKEIELIKSCLNLLDEMIHFYNNNFKKSEINIHLKDIYLKNLPKEYKEFDDSEYFFNLVFDFGFIDGIISYETYDEKMTPLKVIFPEYLLEEYKKNILTEKTFYKSHWEVEYDEYSYDDVFWIEEIKKIEPKSFEFSEDGLKNIQKIKSLLDVFEKTIFEMNKINFEKTINDYLKEFVKNNKDKIDNKYFSTLENFKILLLIKNKQK